MSTPYTSLITCYLPFIHIRWKCEFPNLKQVNHNSVRTGLDHKKYKILTIFFFHSKNQIKILKRINVLIGIGHTPNIVFYNTVALQIGTSLPFCFTYSFTLAVFTPSVTVDYWLLPCLHMTSTIFCCLPSHKLRQIGTLLF